MPSAVARVVLVTGVSRFLGARVAHALQADPGIERVIGVDTVPPTTSLGRTEFVRVDIRTPSIAKVISSAKVDTVVHLNLVTAPTGPRSSMKELNVIGTMQLLAACQRSPDMRKLVVRSSAAVYGSSPRDPAVFAEDDEPVDPPSSGYAKDAVEVEGYVRGLKRRRSDLAVSTLRFANFLAFNVAGDGVLTLSQAIRRAGRPNLPLAAPAMGALGDLGKRFGGLPAFSPELLRWLTYGRVLDTSRLVGELKWRPKYTSEAAFAEFVHASGLGHNLALGLLDRLTGGRR